MSGRQVGGWQPTRMFSCFTLKFKSVSQTVMKVEPKKKLVRYLPFSLEDEIRAVTDSQAR